MPNTNQGNAYRLSIITAAMTDLVSDRIYMVVKEGRQQVYGIKNLKYLNATKQIK